MLTWYSVRDMMPGSHVGKILVYFGSSNNMVLCNHLTDEKNIFKSGQVFSKHDYKGDLTKFVDYPTHWAQINEPEV